MVNDKAQQSIIREWDLALETFFTKVDHIAQQHGLEDQETLMILNRNCGWDVEDAYEEWLL